LSLHAAAAAGSLSHTFWLDLMGSSPPAIQCHAARREREENQRLALSVHLTRTRVLFLAIVQFASAAASAFHFSNRIRLHCVSETVCDVPPKDAADGEKQTEKKVVGFWYYIEATARTY
jgi:hypothetical protein